MSKAKIIVVAGFVVAFGAGLVIGMCAPRSAARDPERRAWMTQELDLSPQQAEQIGKIWSDVMSSARAVGRQQEEQRRAIRKERDEGIVALIPADQKAAYDTLQQEYTARMEQLGQERGKLIEQAVAQTKQLLSDQQQLKFDELMKRREGERRGYRSSRRSEEDATSRPAGR